MKTKIDELMEYLDGYMKLQEENTKRISDIKDEIYQLMNDNNITSYKSDKLSVSFRGKSLIVTHRPEEVSV